MPHGIEVYKDDNVINLGLSMLGGRVFIQFIELSSSNTQTYTFTDVTNVNDLIYYVIDGGAHDITKSTNGLGQVTLTLTKRYTATFSYTTKLAVFAKKITEPTIGVALENSSGEKIASSNYPVPIFQGKVTLPSSPTTSQTNAQNTIKTHSTTSSLGASTDRIVLWTLPENTNNVWFSGTSFIPSNVTNATIAASFYIFDPATPAYVVPEAFIFSLGAFSASAITRGFRLYNSSGTLIFDSGLHHIGIKAFQDFSFPGGTDASQIASSGVFSDASTTLFSGTNPAAILLPDYMKEIISVVDGLKRLRNYTGVFRRQSGNLYTRLALYNDQSEDPSVGDSSYSFGVLSNSTLAVDTSLLAGSTTSPLVAVIARVSGTTSCTYNGSSVSSCTTTETFNVSVAGGNGTAISYSWSLSNAAGFSIPANSTGSSVVVTNSSAAGTYTGTLQCIVTQSGTSLPTLTYSLSHTHSGTALTGNITSNNTVACSYLSPSTTCVTTEVLTANTDGGNGNTKTYSWTIVNPSQAGIFTITNPTSATASIISTGAAGTYTCTAQCVVSQNGSTSLTLTKSISHTHSLISGSVVNPITPLNGANYNQTATDEVFGGTVSGYIGITIASDGIVYLRGSQEGSVAKSTTTSNWWSTASFTNRVPGIGSNYYIRITRGTITTTGLTGSPSVSPTATASTGWVSLASDATIDVTTYQGQDNSVTDSRVTSVPYTIEISSSGSGSPIVSTTVFTIQATANNTAVQ